VTRKSLANDIEKLKEFLESSKSRGDRALTAFLNSMTAVNQSIIQMLAANLEPESRNILLNMLVVHIVTMIECFYRDSLTSIFTSCKPSAYLPQVDQIFERRLSISDVVSLQNEGLSILEIVPRELSFQSLNQISNVFDHFIPKFLRAVE